MMHLRYPHKRDYCTWDELSCLSRALGFQTDTIKNCIPDEITRTEDGLSLKVIQKLIDLKYFNDALDVSINMHSADYNINSILKSLKLLNHRLLSFAKLHDVRVAFQVYEAGDMRGMKIDQHTLMRTLKLCGRTIAPLKLMHRVKHMQVDFDEPGRIQLYEFLDLIVLCEQTDDIEVPDSKRGPLDKTWRKLFELDDFEHVCATNDEKLLNHLNQQFRNTELNYGHEQLGSKRIPRDPAVDTTVRKTQVRFHGKRYKELHKFLHHSAATVQHAKAGCIRGRPVTVPDVDDFRFPSTSPIPQLQRPQTVLEKLSTKSSARPLSAPTSTATPRSQAGSRPRSRPWSNTSTKHNKDELLAATPLMEDPRMKILQAIHERKTLQSAPGGLRSTSLTPKVTFSSPIRDTRTAPENTSRQNRPWQTQGSDAPRPQTTAVVSSQDVTERQNILDSLQYEIETLEERRMQKLKEQIRQHLPRYNLDSLTIKQEKSSPGVKTKKPKQKRERRPSPEAIQRLVHPKPRTSQTLHDKKCDALFQEENKRQGARNKSKPKKKSERRNSNLKQVLMLEGRRCSESTDKAAQEEVAEESVGAKDDIKDEKGNLVETASTLSSRTIESSIGKSMDLVPHPYQVLGSLRRGQVQQKDSEKFKQARVGTAAILYNYFNVGGEVERNDSDQKPDNVSDSTNAGKGHSSDQVNGTGQSSGFIGGKGQSSDHVFGALIQQPALTSKANNGLGQAQLSDPKRSHRDRSKVAPKSANEDGELKINGLSLSEMVQMDKVEKDDDDLW